jgi:polyribonucleotide nucleotidyltransferase
VTDSVRKRKSRNRSQGKRSKAIEDKIHRTVKKYMPDAQGTGVAVGGLTNVAGSLNQMTNHMVEQLNFAHWTDEDKAMYFSQDAKEKALQQKRRILLLQKELEDLQNCKDPTLDNGEDGGDEDDE